MTASKEDKNLDQLVQRIQPQSQLLRIWSLKGGISAQMMALEIMLPDGRTKKMVVRRHGDVDLKQNPNIAADELKLLRILQSAGIAAPTPYHLDQSTEIFPTPYLLLEYIEGKTEFAPSNLTDYILQFATTLARIHRLDSSNLDLSFLPKKEEMYAKKLRKRPANLDQSIDEERIRELLESVTPLHQLNESALLHGDFWSGNLLWKSDQLVAVIDWENAAFGDPLADLANARLDILWAFGSAAMHRFTNEYQSIMTTTDFTHLPYWDLYSALRPGSKIAEWAAVWPDFGREDITEKTMREGLTLFITQALEKLSTQ